MPEFYADYALETPARSACSHWMPDLIAAYIFAMPCSFGDSPAQHNQLRAQEIHSRLLGGQAEHLKHSLAVCNSLLNSALNALAQAHLAHARLTEDLDLLASDFLAYKIRAQAEFLRLSATVEPMPAQLNIARRMAALPYEANPLARIRREILNLEDRVNRLERNLPP